MARAESNRLVLVEEEVEIARAVAFSLGTIEEMAQQADILLPIQHPRRPAAVLWRRGRSHAGSSSTLSNAVKFRTPSNGSVRSSWSKTPRMRASPSASRTPGSASRATSWRSRWPFGQIESSLDRKYDGVGLRIPLLAKTLVELHGGTMIRRSRQGAAVTARFPKERAGRSRRSPLRRLNTPSPYRSAAGGRHRLRCCRRRRSRSPAEQRSDGARHAASR